MASLNRLAIKEISHIATDYLENPHEWTQANGQESDSRYQHDPVIGIVGKPNVIISNLLR